MKNINHWSPRYIYDRLSLAIYEKQNKDHPWLTKDAIALLNSFLKKTDVGLEWGSGRSTVWFASKIQHLVSVEDNPEWYNVVKEKLVDKKLNNTDYYLQIEKDSYIGVVDKFPNNNLDFCLVDGHSWRSSCAVRSVDKIKTGGAIIIDNVNRYLPSNSRSPNSRNHQHGPASEEWQHFLELVKNWQVIWTSNGVFDTAFFIKTL
jgi:predicted O-methyltransferase YrrM